MTPQETQQFWAIFVLIGIPIIVLAGGPYGWRFLVLLGALAGLAYAPMIAIPVLILGALRSPLKWAAEAFIAGLGLRLSGAFNSAERAERQRERFERRRNRR